MINTAEEVVKGVAKALRPFNLPVYVDEVKSNLEYPCFIVLVVNQSHKTLPGYQYEDQIPIQVVYIPGTDETGVNFEMYGMSSKLNYALEVIDVLDFKIRGRNLNSESYNNTLFYNVDYEVSLRKIRDDEKMSKLNIESEVIE